MLSSLSSLHEENGGTRGQSNLPAGYLTVLIIVLGNFCYGKPNGDYADPDNCYGFIKCVNGVPYKMHCPDHLKFNEKTDRCERNIPCFPGCLNNSVFVIKFCSNLSTPFCRF